MNDTNKKSSLIAIIAIVLVVALIGGVCYGVVTAIGSISDSLYDKLDEIESDTTADSEPGEEPGDEPSDEPRDEPSDSGEAPEVNNNPVYSSANEGDVVVWFNNVIDEGTYVMFRFEKHIASSYVKVSWKIDPELFNNVTGLSYIDGGADEYLVKHNFYHNSKDSYLIENVASVAKSDFLNNFTEIITYEYPESSVALFKISYNPDYNDRAILEERIFQYVTLTYQKVKDAQTVYSFSLSDSDLVGLFARSTSDKSLVYYGVKFSGLRPNATYTVSWSIDEAFDDYGISSPTVIENGTTYYNAMVLYSTADTTPFKNFLFLRKSEFLENLNGIEVTTNDEGVIMVCIFEMPYSTYESMGENRKDTITSFINSFKAVEVT